MNAKNMQKSKKKFLLAAFIYLFNGVGNVSQGVFIKHFSSKLLINLYTLIAMRCLVEAVLLLPFSAKYFRNSSKHIWIIIVLALFYSMDMLLWNTGLKTIPANNATLIMLLVPVWITILGHFFLKERGNFGIINFISLLLCLVSVAIVVKGGISAGGFSIGYLLIFGNTLFIAIGLVLQKKFQDVRPVIFAIFTNSVVLGLVSFSLSGFTMPHLSKDLFVAILVISAFDIMEFASVYVAYQMTDVALLQPIRFMRIIFSMVISYFILKETPGKEQIIASVIILLANLLPFLRMFLLTRRKSQVQHAE